MEQALWPVTNHIVYVHSPDRFSLLCLSGSCTCLFSIVRPKTDLDAAVPVAVPKKGGRLLFLKERLTVRVGTH